jgi:hypothetical protein
MWRENKVWRHYVNDIIASDGHSAGFLASYLRYSRINKDYASFLEVIDLQKYKVITQTHKVRIALKERINIPFVFIAGKN